MTVWLTHQNDLAPRPRRGWRVRFGLGSVLLLTTIFCGLMGVWSYYVLPFRATSMLIERITALEGLYQSNPASGPKWHGDLVEYFLGKGRFVELTEIQLDSKAITAEDIRLMGQMRQLQTLTMDHTSFDDEGAFRLATLAELHDLSVRYTQVTDRGAMALVRAPKLLRIYLSGCRISDRTLEAIPTNSNMEVFARWTDITEAGLKKCAQRVSTCQVHWAPRPNGELNL